MDKENQIKCNCEKNINVITYDLFFDEFYCEECLEHHEQRLHKINCSKCLNGETCD